MSKMKMPKGNGNQGGDLGFNGQTNGSEQSGYNSKYQHNQHTGVANKGALMNVGRGPTKAGVTGDHAGPATAAGSSKGHGTQVKCPANYDKQNVGRGPTKGNSKPGGKA